MTHPGVKQAIAVRRRLESTPVCLPTDHSQGYGTLYNLYYRYWTPCMYKHVSFAGTNWVVYYLAHVMFWTEGCNWTKELQKYLYCFS